MNDEVTCIASAPAVLDTLNPTSHGSQRSVSPITPSPPRDLRGIKFIRVISRRLGRSRRRRVDPEEDDDDLSRSSTDSCDRSSGTAGVGNGKSKNCCDGKGHSYLQRRPSSGGSDTGLLYLHSTGSSGSSSSSSSSGSDTSSGHVPRRHSLSPSSSLQMGFSFKRVFQSLTRNSRSHSASRAPSNVQNSDIRRVIEVSGNDAEKKRSILRAPVAYTYVRGLSGLPTQRVRGRCPCVYLPPVVCGATSKVPLSASYRP